MPKFRVKFRASGADDEVIEADMTTESDTSYVFYDRDGNVVAQIPRELVTIVKREEG